MNQTIGIDHVLIVTVNEVNKWLLKTLGPRVSRDMEDLTFFVSWDLEKNRPRVMVDGSGIFFDSLWIAKNQYRPGQICTGCCSNRILCFDKLSMNGKLK